MRSRHAGIFSYLLAGISLAAGLAGPVHAATPPAHMVWAKKLVDTVTPATNEYGDPAKISWKTYNGLQHSTNRSKCASLLSQLLVTAYGKSFAGWLGCTSPIAATYHDRIEVEHGFMLVEGIAAVQVGDVIAIRYLDAGCENLSCGSFTGCRSSGHVALVAEVPVKRVATAPIVPGTTQYEVDIIDSSSDIHGFDDSRYQSDLLGVDDEGVGRGKMRLYVDSVDPTRPIVGYTWSTRTSSVFYSHAARDLVIGRVRGL